MTRNLSDARRSRIVCTKAKRPQATIQQVADENEVPYTTAQRVLHGAVERGTHLPLPKGGGTKMLSERDERNIARVAKAKYRRTPLRTMINRERWSFGTTLLRATLAKKGLRRRVARTAKQLSMKNKKDRRKAAIDSRDVNWDRVMFTDETDLQKHDVGSGKEYILRTKEEVGDPKLMKEKNTTSYERIHVWAAIGKDYKSPLYLMPLKGGHTVRGKYTKCEHLNGGIYAKFVREVMGPCFDTFKCKHPRNALVLCLEDNHGPHNSPESVAAHRALGIARFGHPANSPDLNPIEVCWHILKKKMARWEGMTKSFDELFAIAQQCWAEITLEEVNRQVMKVPIRYKLVHKERGDKICDFHHTPLE